MMLDSEISALEKMIDLGLRLEDEEILDLMNALCILQTGQYSYSNYQGHRSIHELRNNSILDESIAKGLCIMLKSVLNFKLEKRARFEFLYSLQHIEKHEKGCAFNIYNVETKEFIFEKMNFSVISNKSARKLIISRNKRDFFARFINEFIDVNFFDVDDFFSFAHHKSILVQSILNSDVDSAASSAKKFSEMIDKILNQKISDISRKSIKRSIKQG